MNWMWSSPNRTLYYLYRAGDESPYQEHLLEICRQKLAGESGITLDGADPESVSGEKIQI